MGADSKDDTVTFHNEGHHAEAGASPLAPLPDHRNTSTAWWQELWRRHAHITTPLRQRGLECNLEFALSAYVVHVPLPDDSYLIISPPQEPPSSRPPGDPEGWSVTRQHPDDHVLYEVVYDSVPADDPHAPARPEVRNGGSVSHLIEAIDRRLRQLGLLPAPPSPTGLPLMSTAPHPHAPEPLTTPLPGLRAPSLARPLMRTAPPRTSTATQSSPSPNGSTGPSRTRRLRRCWARSWNRPTACWSG